MNDPQTPAILKARTKVADDLRAARAVINKALRNIDKLRPVQLVGLAAAAEQVLLCADDATPGAVKTAEPSRPNLRSV